jgi:predicted metal-binding protein
VRKKSRCKINFDKLIKIKKIPITQDMIKITSNVRNLCNKPYGKRIKNGKVYYTRSKGCPNYGKRLCPPNSKLRTDILTKYNEFTLVIAIFDFKMFKDLRRIHYPEWSEKQLGNSRHWQSAVKSRLRKVVEKMFFDEVLGCGSGFKVSKSRNQVIECQSMESSGINCFLIFKKIGLYYEIHPKTRIVLASLVMVKNNKLDIYLNLKDNRNK